MCLVGGVTARACGARPSGFFGALYMHIEE